MFGFESDAKVQTLVMVLFMWGDLLRLADKGMRQDSVIQLVEPQTARVKAGERGPWGPVR
jgi:hypothetical protein